MMRITAAVPAWMLTLVLTSLAVPALAQTTTYRVDDSGTRVSAPNVQMRWDAITPGSALRAGVSGALDVALRLNTAPWRGHVGRIYMTLPASPSGPLTASWTSQGRLLAGTLRAGERSLIYSGAISGDVLEDQLRLQLQTDGQRLVRAETLNFSFEIDLDGP